MAIKTIINLTIVAKHCQNCKMNIAFSSPSHPVLDLRSSTLSGVCKINGDFNSPDICWSTLTGQVPSSISLCNLTFNHNLSQLVDIPTHNSGNILDLVLSSPSINACELTQVSHPVLQSDHFILSFKFLSTSTNPQPHLNNPSSKFAFKKADFDGLSSYLLDFDFSSYYNSTDIDLS